MPTLLDAIHAPIPAHLDGASLLQNNDREFLHGEHTLGEESTQFIVTKTDKYIWYSQTGKELYFDLAKDPKETHNAISDAQYAQRICQLRSVLIQQLAGREEGYTDGEKLIVGRTPVTCLSNALDKNCP